MNTYSGREKEDNVSRQPKFFNSSFILYLKVEFKFRKGCISVEGRFKILKLHTQVARSITLGVIYYKYFSTRLFHIEKLICSLCNASQGLKARVDFRPCMARTWLGAAPEDWVYLVL